MKLSVLVPSHNVGPRIEANILNACCAAMDDVEVLVRDNSGNAQKRDFLSQIKQKNCRMIIVDECPGLENHQRLLQEAKGEFVFVVGDDDYVNPDAIPILLNQLNLIIGIPSVVGTTGLFVIDNERHSDIFRFNGFHRKTALERVNVQLSGCPSIFQYSPIRRKVFDDVWSYAAELPLYFSYHDWLINGLILAHGKFTYSEEFIYQYFNANWSSPELCLTNDINYYRKAGVDTSCVRLHWLLNAFEGAQTFMNKYHKIDMSSDERLKLSAYWFAYWFNRFATEMPRQAPDAEFDAQAEKLADKWRHTQKVEISMLLDDIAEFFSLKSPQTAERYHAFWK